jgi:hypothetical protein
MRFFRHHTKLSCIALVSLALTGCASFKGEPNRVVPPANYDESTVLQKFTSLSGSAQLAYRNEVAYRWIALADQQYTTFRHNLGREMKGVAAGSSLAVLAFNGAALISGTEASRALAMGSTTIVGANATLSKEAFLDQNIATALTTSQANRMRRLTEIRQKLLSLSADAYPLGDVLIDIRDLNASASINLATAQMARVASEDLVKAQEEAKSVVRLSIVSPEIQTIRAKFSSYVVTVSDRKILDQLATVVEAENNENLRRYQQNIMNRYATLAEGGAAVITALAPAIKTITGEEFK